MLGAYGQVLRTPGALRFTASGFIARMPLAITGLSIVLLVSTTTGSYALAGAMSAGYAIASAGCTILTSRLVDRQGQHRVLPILAAGYAGALVAFVLAITAGYEVVAFIAVMAAGSSQPAIGAAVRARWSHVLDQSALVRSAFAWESILDEVVFTVGPLIATGLALRISLPSPLILAAALTLTGTILLATQRSTQPLATPRHQRAPGERTAIRSPGLPIVAVIAVGLGWVFGSYEVSTVAFAAQAGEATSSGTVLAVWAAASGISGIWFGARHWHLTLPAQAALSTGLLCLGLIPAMLAPTVPWLIAVTVLSGATIAPALIITFSLAERIVAPSDLTEGLTWVVSGLSLGFSVGVAIAGAVVDHLGTTWAFGLAVLGAGSTSLLALARLGALRRAIRPPGEGAEPDSGTVIVPVVEEIPGPGPGIFDGRGPGD